MQCIFCGLDQDSLGAPTTPRCIKCQALRSGTSLLGRFQITGAFGAGTFSYVYQAVDTKHQNKVAIREVRPDTAPSNQDYAKSKLDRVGYEAQIP